MRKIIVIIGSLFAWWGVIASGHPPQVTIRCVSMHGVQVQQPCVGERYRLDVVVMGSVRVQGWPTVAGLDRIEVLGQRTQYSSTNVQGAQRDELIFSFDIQFSRLGKHTFGPAELRLTSGDIVRSALYEIDVVPPAAKSSGAKRLGHAGVDVVTAEWDITTRGYAYCGERVPCRLIVRTTDDRVRLLGISPISCSWLQMNMVQQPILRYGTGRYAGQQEYVWEGDFIPQEAGAQFLPSVSFSYEIPSDHQGWFPWNMLHMVQPRSVTAPALPLEVKSLPSIQGLVVGIGSGMRISWKDVPTHIREGEAVTMTRVIEGTMPSHQTAVPPLSTSSGIRAYMSRVEVKGTLPNVQHCTEYVVHGLVRGDAHIDAQELLFFDPENECYNMCIAPECKITVVEGVPIISHGTQELVTQTIDQQQEQASMIHTNGTIHLQNTSLIFEKILSLITALCDYRPPIAYFIVLMTLPLVWLAVHRYIIYAMYLVQRRYFFAKMRRNVMRELRRAGAMRDAKAVQKTFTEYIMTVVPYGSSETLEGTIENLLVQYDMCEATRCQWRDWLRRLDNAAFSCNESYDIMLLTKEGQELIERIQASLWRSIS